MGSGLDDEDEEVMEEEDIEEEAWLHALEAGEVNERGYLPQKKDYGTLTARQVKGYTFNGHTHTRTLVSLLFSEPC